MANRASSLNATELLSLYDTQLRGDAEVADADELTRIGPLFAATFPGRRRGFITYAEISDPAGLEGLIQAAVDHYASDPRIDHFEWKTRGHDELPGLTDKLSEHGFVFEDSETVMAGSAEAVVAAASAIPSGYRLERAETAGSIRDAETLAGVVFGDTAEQSERQADELVARSERFPDSFEMWLVRDANDVVVCSGRVDFVAGTDFAGLWGGACSPDHRGRGLYRAITVARARSALAKGHHCLQSDCTEYSRPILQPAGLVPITTTTPATWHRA